jgi:hypothetical protein
LRATQILPFRDHTPPPRQLSSGFAPNPPSSKSSDIEPTQIPAPKNSLGVLPKVSLAAQILGVPLSTGLRVSRRCGGEIVATRLRQPCGGEGSEGRALAIPRASGAGWAGAWVARPSRERQTATEPPPRRWHGTDLRTTTAARRTPPTQGATIAAETAAPRGCWPRDPRSGVADKLR